MIAREVNEGTRRRIQPFSTIRPSHSSEEAFFNDLNAMEEIIYEQTGSYTQLCRFPAAAPTRSATSIRV